ncbi:hypothetical protein ACGFNU_49475 [Spirillospora sp. NPDC048911]|uniref:hypothetical protein n=1 Tax=Spirillospora sp. NPDC048911 TaxID=3364527 RepID=UPI003718B575
MWPLAGLAFGTVLGLAAGFGGFGPFLAVLLLGIIGFLAGRVIEGELDLSSLFGPANERRGRSSS